MRIINLVTLVLDLFCVTCLYFGLYQEVSWAYNLAIFWVWLDILTKTLAICISDKKFKEIHLDKKLSFHSIQDLSIAILAVGLLSSQCYYITAILLLFISAAFFEKREK